MKETHKLTDVELTTPRVVNPVSNPSRSTTQTHSKGNYNNLNLVQNATIETALPQDAASSVVDVVAPATLSEGYTFEAQLGDRIFMVQVPEGGVEKGQKFSVPVPTDEKNEGFFSSMEIPESYWKDDLFSCCRYGCIHPLLWNAWFCPGIALAQVMTRMKLNWFGHRGNPQENGSTFKKVLFIVIMYWSVRVISIVIVYSILIDVTNKTLDNLDNSTTKVDSLVNSMNSSIQNYFTFGKYWGLAFSIYLVYAMTRTRTYIREKYHIPGDRCMDCCCSFWCTCCTVSQMARHTANYDIHPGLCCSENGLPEHVAVIV